MLKKIRPEMYRTFKDSLDKIAEENGLLNLHKTEFIGRVVSFAFNDPIKKTFIFSDCAKAIHLVNSSGRIPSPVISPSNNQERLNLATEPPLLLGSPSKSK